MVERMITSKVEGGWNASMVRPELSCVAARCVANLADGSDGAARADFAYTTAKKTEAKNLLKPAIFVCCDGYSKANH